MADFTGRSMLHFNPDIAIMLNLACILHMPYVSSRFHIIIRINGLKFLQKMQSAIRIQGWTIQSNT